MDWTRRDDSWTRVEVASAPSDRRHVQSRVIAQWTSVPALRGEGRKAVRGERALWRLESRGTSTQVAGDQRRALRLAELHLRMQSRQHGPKLDVHRLGDRIVTALVGAHLSLRGHAVRSHVEEEATVGMDDVVEQLGRDIDAPD